MSKVIMQEAAEKHLWNHMTPYSEHSKPMIVSAAKGSWITDYDGNRYFDAMSGLWCVNIGYGREELVEAAAEQLRTLSYYPLTQSHEPGIKLSQKLSEWLGEEYKTFFSNSGSEANETAFKIARQYHAQQGQPQRQKFISRYRAYHGSTAAALAATGQQERKYKYEPLPPGFLHAPPPYCYRCPFGKTANTCSLECASVFEEMICYEGAETVAGIIMEPVITGGGVIVPPDGYLKKVREICDKYDVLLIIDEVICAFGRSGARFGHQVFGVTADIVTMAKGITSGYLPLSATAVRREIYQAFQSEAAGMHLRHVNTFGGNPASCALALKNMELLEREGLIEGADLLGEFLAAQVERLRRFPIVGDIRRFGFLCGIELVKEQESKTPLSLGDMNRIVAACRSRGLIVGKNGDTVAGFNNILALCPPLVSTTAEIEMAVNVLEDVLDMMAQK